MKYRPLFLSILTIVVLMFASCEKVRPTMAYVSGDDKDKIDLKGNWWGRLSMSTSTRLSSHA